MDKKRLFLAGGVALIIASGLAIELVKVPVQNKIVNIEKIPVTADKVILENGTTRLTFEVPEGYLLLVNENGEAVAYRETTSEVTEEITLNEYFDNYLFGNKR